MNKHLLILTNLLLATVGIYAQGSFVLWDKANNIPVNRASVYTTYQGKVRNSFSDQQGRVTLNFSFDSLTVSHINYQKTCIRTLPDTLFLMQTIQMLPEFVVGNTGEPAWIKPMLEDFVKTKTQKYTNGILLKYDYQTQNIGDTLLYRFQSQGLVRKNNLYEIDPQKNIITFKDQTAGCDFSNLKNTLYHDFVSDMDEKFVKEHRFYLDNQAEEMEANVVRILFKSKKEWKDSGYIYIDTLRNVILRAKRSTGLDYNVKAKTNAFVRSTFSLFAGHTFKDWQIDVEVEYLSSGESMYLSTCHYSNYRQEELDYKKIKGCYTYDMTSTYHAQPSQEEPSAHTFIPLPKPWIMKIIVTKKDQLQEQALQNINKENVVY